MCTNGEAQLGQNTIFRNLITLQNYAHCCKQFG